jgi:anti-anti-sigma factor
MEDSTSIVACQDENEDTITASGTLDLTHAEELNQLLWQATMSFDSVVVDLRKAMFIDTAILGCLATAGKAMLNKGKRLKLLVSAESHPAYVLRTVGFGQLMDISIGPVDPDVPTFGSGM